MTKFKYNWTDLEFRQRNCRRMKMRCVGGENPPCERCAHANLDCVMEQRPKPAEETQGTAYDFGLADQQLTSHSRLQFLEDQVVHINQTLSELVSLLQSRVSRVPDDQVLSNDPLSPRGARNRPVVDIASAPGTSLPPSRAISEGPEGLMDSDDISRPLEAMSNMAGLVEAAMERSKEEKPDARRPKRARFASPPPSGPTVVEHPLSPLHSSKRQPDRQVIHIHAYPDAVALGLVSEDEGRSLMQMYV